MANPFWLTNAIAEFHSVNKAYAMCKAREDVLNRLVERMTGRELGEYMKQTAGLPDGTTCTFCHTPGVKENEIALVLFTIGDTPWRTYIYRRVGWHSCRTHHQQVRQR